MSFPNSCLTTECSPLAAKQIEFRKHKELSPLQWDDKKYLKCLLKHQTSFSFNLFTQLWTFHQIFSVWLFSGSESPQFTASQTDFLFFLAFSVCFAGFSHFCGWNNCENLILGFIKDLSRQPLDRPLIWLSLVSLLVCLCFWLFFIRHKNILLKFTVENSGKVLTNEIGAKKFYYLQSGFLINLYCVFNNCTFFVKIRIISDSTLFLRRAKGIFTYFVTQSKNIVNETNSRLRRRLLCDDRIIVRLLRVFTA